MKYEFLNGRNLKSDLLFINESLAKNPYVVFLYKSCGKYISMDAYISAISDKTLAGCVGIKPAKLRSIIYNLKVCNEKTNLDLICRFNNGELSKVTSISQLLNILDVFEGQIVVNNNSRTDFAFVLQQLIYIGYPVDKLKIMLKNEEKLFENALFFADSLDEILESSYAVVNKINMLFKKVYTDTRISNRAELLSFLRRMLDYSMEIQENLIKSQNFEIKVEVAASKKAGKSVIVNSMIGEQLAPASVTQATPNTCIYRKSFDNLYHIQSVRFDESSKQMLPVGNGKSFSDREDLYKKVNEEFKKAEQSFSNGFSIDDIEIRYVSKNDAFCTFAIYDTPGPNAAGTAHSESATYALEVSDVSIFVLDYTKYLTNDELYYLNAIKAYYDKHNKFRSLVFALNKIDMRYEDGSNIHSVIRDTEFIRNRLIAIDKKFSECIIFPVSALVYFDVLATERANIPRLRESCELENEIYGIIKECDDEIDKLVFLMEYINNLNHLSGVTDISLEFLKKESGMPALLDYVSYIAKSNRAEKLKGGRKCSLEAEKKKLDLILESIREIGTYSNIE